MATCSRARQQEASEQTIGSVTRPRVTSATFNEEDHPPAVASLFREEGYYLFSRKRMQTFHREFRGTRGSSTEKSDTHVRACETNETGLANPRVGRMREVWNA